MLGFPNCKRLRQSRRGHQCEIGTCRQNLQWIWNDRRVSNRGLAFSSDNTLLIIQVIFFHSARANHILLFQRKSFHRGLFLKPISLLSFALLCVSLDPRWAWHVNAGDNYFVRILTTLLPLLRTGKTLGSRWATCEERVDRYFSTLNMK